MMARFHACTLLVLGLLAVCDGKLFSSTGKLKGSFAKAMAQKRAPGRKLSEDCATGTSMRVYCTGEGAVDTYGVMAYTNKECSGDAYLTMSIDDFHHFEEAHDGHDHKRRLLADHAGGHDDEELVLTCTDMSDDSTAVVASTRPNCTGGMMSILTYTTSDCTGTGTPMEEDDDDHEDHTGAPTTPGATHAPTSAEEVADHEDHEDEGPPMTCECSEESTELLATMKAELCFMDCEGADDLHDCAEVDALFAKDCAKDCTAEDLSLIAAELTEDAEHAALALCPTFTASSASTATGMVFAALVSIGALLLA